MGAALCFPREVFGFIGHYESYGYHVVKDYGTWQLRRYAPAVAVEAGGDGDDEKSFVRLAKYIGVFSTPENSKRDGVAMTTPVVTETIAMTTPVVTETIAMTTPVVTESIAMTTPVVTGGCLMRFVLPSKYKTIEDAPVPTDPKVRLVAVPEKDMAVLRFRGKVTGNAEAEAKYHELVRLAAEKGLSPDGKWELHRFNPPYTLPFLRTNEVLFPVSK